MPLYEARDPISRPAATALTTERVFSVVNSSNQIALAAAGGRADGVLRYAVSAIGDEATIETDGNLLVTAGGNVTAGDDVMADSSGKAVKATAGNIVLGRCLVGGGSGAPILIEFYEPAQLLKGYRRFVAVALAAVDTAGGVFAWQNPEAGAIIVETVVIDVTTKATAASTLDIGTTAVSATTSSNNLLTALDVGTAAGTFNNIDDKGASGKSRQRLATGAWVTASKASGATAGIVGSAYISYFVL